MRKDAAALCQVTVLRADIINEVLDNIIILILYYY